MKARKWLTRVRRGLGKVWSVHAMKPGTSDWMWRADFLERRNAREAAKAIRFSNGLIPDELRARAYSHQGSAQAEG